MTVKLMPGETDLNQHQQVECQAPGFMQMYESLLFFFFSLKGYDISSEIFSRCTVLKYTQCLHIDIITDKEPYHQHWHHCQKLARMSLSPHYSRFSLVDFLMQLKCLVVNCL